jgi:hypothetical protein
VCCLCLLQGRVAGLLWPRPFLNKLSNALFIRKFWCRIANSLRDGTITSKDTHRMGDEQIFSKNLHPSLFNDDLSNELNFG